MIRHETIDRNKNGCAAEMASQSVGMFVGKPVQPGLRGKGLSSILALPLGSYEILDKFLNFPCFSFLNFCCMD